VFFHRSNLPTCKGVASAGIERPHRNDIKFIGKRTVEMEHSALYLQDSHDLRDGLDCVRYAESQGFEAVWQAESRLVRDAIVPMSAYAAVTDRIKVGSAVINNWSRNIGLLAATFLTLDDLAPNRIICGIGERNRHRITPPAQHGTRQLRW
jgi:alkanesulfonate monooxygenase SsuD/methylene tetrahydromethanopterin reductase-like flavin-dependent oxidoreductase (luciferase family)